jgi:hypothetical protein
MWALGMAIGIILIDGAPVINRPDELPLWQHPGGATNRLILWQC